MICCIDNWQCIQSQRWRGTKGQKARWLLLSGVFDLGTWPSLTRIPLNGTISNLCTSLLTLQRAPSLYLHPHHHWSPYFLVSSSIYQNPEVLYWCSKYLLIFFCIFIASKHPQVPQTLLPKLQSQDYVTCISMLSGQLGETFLFYISKLLRPWSSLDGPNMALNELECVENCQR